MAKLYYQGHGSFRITTNAGKVIYVDPFAGDGYDLPADFVLITHEHYDHNQIDLLTLKEDTTILRETDFIVEDGYKTIHWEDVVVTGTEAYNKNHKKEECVGYLIQVDGVLLYAAGDTSTTEQMSRMKDLKIDYALLPTDGHYNMDPIEATQCAEMIGARYSIPIHTKPGELFSLEQAQKFTASNRLIIQPKEEIELEGSHD